MHKAIVAIGGGKIRTRGTLAIDREIIRLSGKKRPKVLFVPTASSDDEDYWQRFRIYFGDFLGCRTDVLFLVKGRPSREGIRREIEWADIIYVGGGNTLMMMRLWRRLGVDKMLAAAYGRGTVLCGVSAGSICWFDSGHSDSMSFYNPRKWKYINVKGLGFIKGIHCPHYDSQTLRIPRRAQFRQMIGKLGGLGIAIENNCAIEFVDGEFYKVLTSKSRAGAYAVTRRKGKVVSKRIRQTRRLTPIAELARS